jgi:hypothetical protein
MSIEKFYKDCIHRILDDSSESNTGRVIDNYTNVDIRGYKGKQVDGVRNLAGKTVVDTKYKFFSSTYNFKNGDLIVYEGKTYEIAGEPKNTANRSHHCLVYIRRIEGVT